MEVPNNDVSKFGICGGNALDDRSIELTDMVEKPKLEDAPSNLAIVGRYILTPRIFEILENTSPGKNGEIQLTDAMAQLMKEDGFLGYKFEGERFDAGDKLGFLKANINFALKRPDLEPRLKEYLRSIL